MKGIFGAALVIIFSPFLQSSFGSKNNDCHRKCMENSLKIFLTEKMCTGQIQMLDFTKERISKPNPSTHILLFNTSPAANLTNCSFPEIGVCLLKNSDGYKISITRNMRYRPQFSICLVHGTHNINWINENLDNCTIGVNYTNCENMTCLDPRNVCEKAKYNSTHCTENNSNDDIVSLSGQSPACVKCGNPYTSPEMGINNITVNLSPKPPNSTSYCHSMKILRNRIVDRMGDKSSASISSGEDKGIFVKSESTIEFITLSFAYHTSTFSIVEDKTQMSLFERAFSVPKEALEKAYNITKETPSTSLFRLSSFEQDEKNSMLWKNEVFSIDVGAEIMQLSNPVSLTFRNVDQNAGSPKCHSWNGEGLKPNWTTEGCNTTFIDNTVTCTCTHLTFFAVLMTDPNQEISSSDLTNLTYITSIGCGLSIFFLSVCLFMHFLLRKGQASDSVHILINLLLAILLLNLTFVTNESVANTKNTIGCKLMAGLMHYFMLSSFQWFFIEALHLCLQLTRHMAHIQNYLVKVRVAGWVPPAIIVTCIFAAGKYNILVIHTNTEKSVNMCWLTDSDVQYVVNISYYVLVFLFTFLTFVVMLYWIFLLRSKRPNTATVPDKMSSPLDAGTIMGLCTMLGLSWGFAFFAYGPLRIPALYIFTIFNSFQGFFLFIYYFVTSKPDRETEASSENVTKLENLDG